MLNDGPGGDRSLPPSTPGIIAAPCGDLGALVDPATGELVVLNPSAFLLWQACAAGLGLDQLVAQVVGPGGADPATVADDVAVGLAALVDAGLVGGDPRRPPSPPEPVATGVHEGPVWAVVDERVAFDLDLEPPRRAEVASALAAALAPMAADGMPTVRLRIDDRHGPLRLVGAGTRQVHASVAGLVDALPATLNLVAAGSRRCLVLHAAAVRSPGGALVVLAGASGAGKSTLCAQLVRAGWGYLGDEAVGLDERGRLLPYAKPLALDGRSRALLGLPATDGATVALAELGGRADGGGDAPSAFVVLGERTDGPPRLVPLATVDALVALGGQALNLAVAGAGALRTLVAQAEHGRTWTLDHAGDGRTVDALAELVDA